MRNDVLSSGRLNQWRLDPAHGWVLADTGSDLPEGNLAAQALILEPKALWSDSGVTAAPGPDPLPAEPLDLALDSGAVRLTAAEIAPTLAPSDPLYGSQWHLGWIGRLGTTGFVGLERIWDDYRGQNVRVGVWDSGTQGTHWDLDGNYNATRHVTVSGVGTNDGQPVVGGSAHGTAVGGLIAAEANGQGGVGVAFQAQVTGVTIFGGAFDINSQYSRYLSTLTNGLPSFDVTNHSYGLSSTSSYFSPASTGRVTPLDASVDNGRGGLGTNNLNAAGNANANANGEDWSASRFTITVAALDNIGRATGSGGGAASYSSYGANILVSAPAGSVTTDLLGAAGYASGDYTTGFNGTSAATPVTAGVVSLMLSANSGLGWRDVQNILAVSAVGVGSYVNAADTLNEKFAWRSNGATNWNGGGAHISEDYGYGMVNAFQAVRMAEAWSLFGSARTSVNEGSLTTGNVVTNLAIGAAAEAGFSFNVAGGLEIEHVSLTVTLQHTWFPDINLFLVSPTGTRVMLLDGSAGNSSTSDASWTYTFGVDLLRGEMAAGTWQLRWSDLDPLADNGTITAVNFTAFGRTETANDVYHYTDEALVAVSRNNLRLALNDTDGGIDWINASGMWRDVVLDLRTGAFSSLAGGNIIQMGAGVIEHAIVGDGNDFVIGNAAANQLYGGRGDDNLMGGVGADYLAGGLGFDYARYDFSSAAVFVRLDTGAGLGGEAAGDLIVNIEGAFGSAFGDTLQGSNTSADILVGLGGDDTLYGQGGGDQLLGGEGSDQLIGGTGADYLDGGTGFDYARYDFSSAAVSVRLDTGVASGGEAAGDVLVSIDGLVGSAFGDTLVGSNTSADGLVGQGGDDLLYGQGGGDLLLGGEGSDQLIGGAGADYLDGGTGFDYARYDFSSAGVFVRLDTGHTSGGEAAGDVLVSIEALIGSAFGDAFVGFDTLGDLLVGLDGDDTLLGQGGADQLYGGNNNDQLYGGAGADYLDGGAGFDYARYDFSSAGVFVRLDTGAGLGGEAAGDLVVNIEGLVGSAFGDTFVGSNTLGDVLFGLNGDDTLYGQGGADQLYGGDGIDQLLGGTGADYLEGGTGFDYARYDFSSAGVFVRLDTGVGLGGEAAGDLVVSIEGLVGSAFGDTFVGSNTLGDVLYGLNGDDTLYGQGGGDQLLGGEGNDLLFGGLGADVLLGGTASDVFWTQAGEMQAGIWDVIMDFGEASLDFDYLFFQGFTRSSLTLYDQGADCVITSSAVGFTGGIIVRNFSTAQIADQLFFG